MWKLGRHEKTPFQRIRESNLLGYLMLAAVLTMPVWMPMLGLI